MSIPNTAFSGMKYFNQTIESYKKANWWKKIFINPYKVFYNLMQRSIIV